MSPQPPSSATDGVLPNTSTIVCLGPGGVGKTSLSASIAVALAEQGLRVVVLTIDPARRLADAMGLGDGLGNAPQTIAGPWKGELWATMLDPRATFTEVVERHAADPEQAEKILANRLFSNLTTSLSGTGEYMASERLYSLHRDDRFDVVVVDTPPSRHAFDFLDSPGRLTRFVDHPLYRTILSPRSGMLKAISKANQLAARTISRVVGSELLSEVVDFFALFQGMDRGFRDRAASVDAHLAGRETSYVVVASARDQAVDEVRWISDNLTRRGRSVDLLVVNRVLPPVFATTDDVSLPTALRRNAVDFASQIDDEQAAARALSASIHADRTCMIPQFATPISDVDGLRRLAEYLQSDHSSAVS